MVIEQGTLALTWVDRRTLGYDARKQWGARTKTLVLNVFARVMVKGYWGARPA